MKQEMIKKVLGLLDDQVTYIEKLTGQEREEQETIYAGLSTMAEFILTDGDDKESYYEAIVYDEETKKHTCKIRERKEEKRTVLLVHSPEPEKKEPVYREIKIVHDNGERRPINNVAYEWKNPNMD